MSASEDHINPQGGGYFARKGGEREAPQTILGAAVQCTHSAGIICAQFGAEMRLASEHGLSLRY